MSVFFINHVGQFYSFPEVRRWNQDCYRIIKNEFQYWWDDTVRLATEWVPNSSVTSWRPRSPNSPGFWETREGWVTTHPSSSSDVVIGSIITKYPVCTQNLFGQIKVRITISSKYGSEVIGSRLLKVQLYCNDGFTKIGEHIWGAHDLWYNYPAYYTDIQFDIPDARILQGKLVIKVESVKNDELLIEHLKVL